MFFGKGGGDMRRFIFIIFLTVCFMVFYSLNSEFVDADTESLVIEITALEPSDGRMVSPGGFVLEGMASSPNGIERIEIKVCHEKFSAGDSTKYVCMSSNGHVEYNAYSKIWRYEVPGEYLTPGRDVDIEVQAFDRQGHSQYPLMDTLQVAQVWPPDKEAPSIEITYVDVLEKNLVSREGFTIGGIVTDDRGIKKVLIDVCYEEPVFIGFPIMRKVCSVYNHEIPFDDANGYWNFEVSHKSIKAGRIWFEVKAVDMANKITHAPIQTLQVVGFWPPQEGLPTVKFADIAPFEKNSASPDGFQVSVEAQSPCGIDKVLVDVCYIQKTSLGEQLGYHTHEVCFLEKGEAIDDPVTGNWSFYVLPEYTHRGQEALLKVRAVDLEGTSSIEILRRVPIAWSWPPDEDVPVLSIEKPANNGDIVSGGENVISGSAEDDRGINKIIVDVCYDERRYIGEEIGDIHYEVCSARNIEASYDERTKQWKCLFSLVGLSAGTEVRYKIKAVDVAGKTRVAKRVVLVGGFIKDKI